MKSEHSAMELALREIEELQKFFTTIEHAEESSFDKELEFRLKKIDELTIPIPHMRNNLMRRCFNLSGKEMNPSIIMKHAREKPLGYPGDYGLIEYTYANVPQSNSVKGKLWDKVFLRQHAAQAVRNRIDFFKHEYLSIYEERNEISVLNLASGPCREIMETLNGVNPDSHKSYFHCVDQDPGAISHAKELLLNTPCSQVVLDWERNNVFKIRPHKKYSLIWSAGLFDYLDDRLSVALIKRMWRWLDDGGRIIVGNFHPRNPNRNHIEWCLGWFLIHRTQNDFVDLCKKAEIPERCVQFKYEPLRVNIFLVINKPY